VPGVDGSAPARGDLDKFMERVLRDRGFDLTQYRRAYVERRLAARLRNLELHTYRAYADLLDADPTEHARMLDTLTINVTDFFRDAAVWSILRNRVIPDLVADKLRGRSRTIRIWSAGCASGEEPYSIAMMVLDVLGKDADKFLINVLGTDLDPDVLRVAEKARYHRDMLKNISPSYQVRFTRPVGKTEFEIKSDVAHLVRFRHSSLFGDSPMKVVDLILCRNVFIYLDRPKQMAVLERFWGSLARGGYLVLGRSEKMPAEMARRFEPIEPRERIYRRPNRI